MAFGYDLVVNGASISMPAFLIYFGDMGPSGPYLPSVWTALWTAMTNLAQCVGGFAIGYITDRYGRKWPTVVAGALTMAGTSMQYCSTSRGLLLGGKMVNGVGIGAAMATATAYASEVLLKSFTIMYIANLLLGCTPESSWSHSVLSCYVYSCYASRGLGCCPKLCPEYCRILLQDCIRYSVGSGSLAHDSICLGPRVSQFPPFVINETNISGRPSILSTMVVLNKHESLSRDFTVQVISLMPGWPISQRRSVKKIPSAKTNVAHIPNVSGVPI